jgi:hypothetical protein
MQRKAERNGQPASGSKLLPGHGDLLVEHYAGEIGCDGVAA